MTYRLKDEQLQRKLDKLTDGEFTSRLEGISLDLSDFRSVRIPLGEFLVEDGDCVPRIEVFVRSGDLEVIPERTNKELNTNIREGIRDLHGIFSRIKADLDDDEPAAASVRWGLAKGIVGCIDEWLDEYERRKKEGKE